MQLRPKNVFGLILPEFFDFSGIGSGIPNDVVFVKILGFSN